MSLHNRPEFNTPGIIDGLKLHGMEHDEPSQLADAFRQGYVYAMTPPQTAGSWLLNFASEEQARWAADVLYVNGWDRRVPMPSAQPIKPEGNANDRSE